MKRAYIGFTSKGPTILRNIRRAPTGEPLLLLDESAAAKVELDFTDFLESGETISGSASVTYEGVTGSTSTSSPRVTLTLSAATTYDLAGKATYVVTFSSGEIFRGILRVRRTSRYADDVSVLRNYV